MYGNNDIDRLDSSISDIESEMWDLKARLSELEELRQPYYLMGWRGEEKECLGVFFSSKDMNDFIRSCRRKSKPFGYLKRSPLGKVDRWEVERFIVPEGIPVNPKFK